jgi:hypothetical protein
VCQSVRNHIERGVGQGGGANNRRGGPPPGNGRNGGPPPGGNGGNGGTPRGGNRGNGGLPGRNGGNGAPPPAGGNDRGGRRGRAPSRGARNAAVPRRPNPSVRSDRSSAGAGPRRDPDSDDGAPHPCDGFFFPTINLMLFNLLNQSSGMLFLHFLQLWSQSLASPAHSHHIHHLVPRRRYSDRYRKLALAPQRHKLTAIVVSPP